MNIRIIPVGVMALMACNAMRAQEIIVTNDLQIIEAYHLEIAESRLFYSTSQNEDAPFHSILKSDVLVLKKSDGTKLLFDDSKPATTQPSPSQPAVKSVVSNTSQSSATTAAHDEEEDYDESALMAAILNDDKEETVKVQPVAKPTLPAATYSDKFLLKPGNKVFIPVNSDETCERIVQNMIVKCVKERGLWTIVDTPEKAQFMIEYRLNLGNINTGTMLIESRKSYFDSSSARSSASPTQHRAEYFVLGSEYLDAMSVLEGSAFGRKHCAKLTTLMDDIATGNKSELLKQAQQYLSR